MLWSVLPVLVLCVAIPAAAADTRGSSGSSPSPFLARTEGFVSSQFPIYISPSGTARGSSTEAGVTMLMPDDCSASRLRVQARVPGQWTCTLRANGADTPVGCTTTAANGRCKSPKYASTWLHDGDQVAVRCTAANGVAPSPLQISWVCK